MAAPRVEDVWNSIRATAPRTGPPVRNMAGTPALPAPSAPQAVVQQPVVQEGKPGPAPQATAPAPAAAPAAPAPVTTLDMETRGKVRPEGGQPAPAPAVGPLTGQPLVGALPAPPTAETVATLPPGAAMSTPTGEVYRDPSGRAMERLNPQGQADYKAKQAAALERFGRYLMMDDPNAPPPPIEVAGVSYNPYTGQWLGE